MNKVQILMSTYNGEKFIADQINSLVQQSYQPIHLLIRDDGSFDETCSTLTELSKKNKTEISAKLGHNIGVINSFLDLLKDADPDASYYSFCDQDDVWKPDKMKRAISQLTNIPSDIPSMYCSRTEMVDEHLNHLSFWPPIPNRGPSFSNAIIENIAVGCTTVINRAAKELILKRLPDTNRLIMHDWWIYLCVSAFGHVVYDSETNILYRQHDNNITGGTAGFVQKWSKRSRMYNNRRKMYRKQAEEFYRLFKEDLSEEKKEVIERFLHSNSTLSNRISYFNTTEVFRQSKLESYFFRLMYLLNKI